MKIAVCKSEYISFLGDELKPLDICGYDYYFNSDKVCIEIFKPMKELKMEHLPLTMGWISIEDFKKHFKEVDPLNL